MKRLLIGLLGLVILVIAAPFFTGFYIEHIQDEHAALIQRQNPFLEVEKTAHQRGWFSSNSVYEYRPVGQAADGFQVIATVRSHHGPLPFGSLSDPSAEFRAALAVIGYQIDINEMLATTGIGAKSLPSAGRQGHLDFTGNYHYRCDLAAGQSTLELPGKKPLTVDWEPINCAGSSRFLSGDEHYDIAAPKVAVRFFDDDRITLEQLTYNAAISNADTDYPLLNGSFEIGQASVVKGGEEDPSMVANSISLKLANSDSNGLLNGSIDYRVGSMAANDASYQGLFAKFSITDADKTAVAQLRSKLVDTYLAMTAAKDDAQARTIADDKLSTETVLATLPLLADAFNQSEFAIGWESSKSVVDLAPLVNSVMDVSSKGFEFKLYSSNLRNGLPLGGYSIVLDEYELAAQPIKLGVTPPPFKLLRLQELQLQDYAETQSETSLRVHTEYKLGSLLLDSIRIKDAIYSLSAEDINRSAADQITRVLIPAFSDALFGKAHSMLLTDPDKRQIDAALPALLGKARLKLNALTFATPNGQTNATATASLQQVPKLEEFNGPAWINEIVANGQLNIDKSLVTDLVEMVLQQQISSAGFTLSEERQAQMRETIQQQADATLNDYVHQGLLLEQTNGYRSEAELKAGELSVNGKDLPLF